MSLEIKRVHGNRYLYLQYYIGGKRFEKGLGRVDDPESWSKAAKLYDEYLNKYVEHQATEFKLKLVELARKYSIKIKLEKSSL